MCTHTHTRLFLEGVVNRSAAVSGYKAWKLAGVQSDSSQQTSAPLHSASLCASHSQLMYQGMKRRRLLLSPPLLPTITETLEDSPVHPSPSQSAPGPQSQDDYMSSIQALARPAEAPSCGPVRLQRTPRLRLFSKAPVKLSASTSLPRGAPRAMRTARPSGAEDFPLRTARERDCWGTDPVDWLFAQIRT